MRRSERGDVSLEPVMIVATMVFVPLLATVIIASILRNGVLDTVAVLRSTRYGAKRLALTTACGPFTGSS